MYRSRASLLALFVVGLSVAPSACSLPFAYVDGDGSGGEGGDDGNEEGSGAASSGSESGGSGGDETGGASSDGDTGGAGTGGDASDGDTGGSGASGGGGGTGGGAPDGIVVALDATHQTIEGFGISTAIAPQDPNLPLDNLFGTSGPDAIGLSILRIGMDSDGSLSGSYIDEAKQRGAQVIGTVWSPPGAWRDNTSTVDGGHLLPAYYESWATNIAQFAAAHDLDAMSIGNAPDFASCPTLPICTDSYDTTVYSALEMVAWVKAAADAFSEHAPGVAIIAPEVSEWNHLWSNLSATGSLVASHPNSSDPLACGCFSNELTSQAETACDQDCANGDGYDYGHWLWEDLAAWNAFDIIGVQQYDSQRAYAWPADVNGGARNKDVWVTEMGGIRHWPEEGPSIDIENGVAVAGWIHSALTIGEASAWLYWWYESYFLNRNDGLALVQDDPTIAKRYYTLGNYSKFVRRGFVAVSVLGDEDPD